MYQNYKWYTFTSVVFLVLIYCYMLSVNLLNPLFADDYGYSFNLDTGKRIGDFSDVVDSQVKHYFAWGGRNVAQSLAQGFLYIGKTTFSFFNAFVFILLILLIYWHSQGEVTIRLNPFTLGLITLFCWFSLPRFGETVIWLTGACNYLWMSVLILFFLLPYRLKLLNSSVSMSRNTIAIAAAMFFLGVVCGWTNENSALMMLVATCGAVYYFWKRKICEFWTVAGLAGSVVGYLLLILAPGNFVRMKVFTNMGSYSFSQDTILDTLSMTIRILLQYQIPLLILLAIVFRIIFRRFGNKLSFQTMVNRLGMPFILGIFFVVLSVLNNLVMVGSPFFPKRAGFASSVFFMIGVMIFLKLDFIKTIIFDSRGKKAVIGMLCFLFLPSAFFTLKSYETLNRENTERLGVIISSKAKGINELEVKRFSVKDKSVLGHVHVHDITTNTERWENKDYARYFELQSIRLIGTDNR